MPSCITTLFCLLYGEPFKKAFPVKINSQESVGVLRGLVKGELPGLSGIGANELRLWKVDIPMSNDKAPQTPELRDEDRLCLGSEIRDEFPTKPAKKHIHVIVKVHEQKKRKGSPLNQVFASRVKRLKVVQIDPSTLAHPSTYELIQQNSDEKILDDQPEEDENIPPISLLYHGFGQFLDIAAGRTDVEGFNVVEAGELEYAVDKFAQEMCGHFGSEEERRERGIWLLNYIFTARKRGCPPTLTAAAPIWPVRMEGHYTGDHGVVVSIGEFKNWSAGNSGIPEVKLVGHFARSFAREVQDRPRRPEGWRVPGLGITIIGSDVKFYAMLSLDTQFRLVSLTPTLSCIRSASEGDDRDALYRAFTAASVLQARILEDALHPQCFMVESTDICFPGVSKLRSWPNTSDDALEFQIQGNYEPRENRLLYLAIHDGRTILVKFVRRYCPELHSICAASGHAPALLGYERLPGGWHGVAMEYVADAVSISLHDHISEHFDHWKTDLQGLVAEFHAQGFVHGGLRDANIVSGDDGCVKLVDFDWGGKDGAVSYPTPRLNPELVVGRSSEDLIITKADDLRILDKTLAKISVRIPRP